MSKKTTGILIGLAAAGAIAAGTAAVIKYLSNKEKATDYDDDFEDLDDVEESRNYVNIPLDNEEGGVAEDLKDMAEDTADACCKKAEDIADACCEKAEDIADACCEKAENAKESIKDVIDDIEDTLDDITE